MLINVDFIGYVLRHKTLSKLLYVGSSQLIKAKFYYTGPTGPDRTRADFFARPGPQTRVSDKVRAGPPSGIYTEPYARYNS